MSDVLGFIDTGCTESGFIEGVPRLYPSVAFTFQPMLIDERTAYLKAGTKLDGLQLRQLAARYLESHLKDWDLRDAKDDVVSITTANLLRLKERLFNRLFAVVSTEEPPDARPEQTPEEAAESLDDLVKATETERPVQEISEERQRKN